MKKLTMRNFKSKINIKLAAALILILSFNAVTAQSTAQDSPASVKYVSTLNDKVAFQVQFDNEEGEKFSISIKDENENLLFQSIYTDRKFDKKFILDKNIDYPGVTFLIKSLKTGDLQTFKVSAVTNYVENYTVSNVSK